MKATYDFWLGESVTPDVRYDRRHKRDGLCRQCPRKALDGHVLCARHNRENNERIARLRTARRNVNTTDNGDFGRWPNGQLATAPPFNDDNDDKSIDDRPQIEGSN
jgi:hypothetical protein